MNPYTGEVREFISSDAIPQSFVEVPQRLERSAKRVIKHGGQVDLNGNSKLAKFARAQRKKLRKQASKSRARNR